MIPKRFVKSFLTGNSIDYLDCGNVGDRAFYLCTGLNDVQLRDGAALGQEVFGLCVNLDPGAVFRIPDNASRTQAPAP